MEKLNPSVVLAEDNKSAVISFDKDDFTNFIGEELAKAQTEILEKACTYINNVTQAGYTKAGELFAETEELGTVDIEASFMGEANGLQAHIKREDIDLVETEDYTPAMKINSTLTSASEVRSSVKTMASTYRDILAKRNS